MSQLVELSLLAPVVGKIYIEHLFTVNCVEKTNKEKEAGNGRILKDVKLFIEDEEHVFKLITSITRLGNLLDFGQLI